MPPLSRMLALASCALLAACAEVSAPSSLRPTPSPDATVAARAAAGPECRLALVALSVETTAAAGFASASDQRALLRATGAAGTALDEGRRTDAAQTVAMLAQSVRALGAADRLESGSVAPLTAAAQRALACLAPTGS